MQTAEKTEETLTNSFTQKHTFLVLEDSCYQIISLKMLMASRTGNNKNCQAENGGGLFSHQDKQDQVALNIMSKTTAHTVGLPASHGIKLLATAETTDRKWLQTKINSIQHYW